jgi:hypothetical protein
VNSKIDGQYCAVERAVRSLHHVLIQAQPAAHAAPPTDPEVEDLSFTECRMPAAAPSRPQHHACGTVSGVETGEGSAHSSPSVQSVAEHADGGGADFPCGIAPISISEPFLTPRSDCSDGDGGLLLAEAAALVTRRNPLCTGALADLWGTLLPMLATRLALLERAAADGSEQVAFCERLDSGLWAQVTVQGEALRNRLMAKLTQLQRMRVDVCDDAAVDQRHTLQLFSLLWTPKGTYAVLGPSSFEGARAEEFHCLRVVSPSADVRSAVRMERTASDEQAAALRALRPQAGRARLVPRTDGSFLSMAAVIDIPLDGRTYTAFTALAPG